MKFILKDMFYKEIDRDIKGVIKVGQEDDENVKQELDEYVVTSELKKHIDEFFEMYKTSILEDTDKNGVWISGFFGSGKSHLLKILSYLLENKIIDGKNAIDYFSDKGLDNFTLENMKLAGDTPTDVILFNIDSKSEADSKSNKDAIVNVFNKVFSEMQGFCGSMPWIANMERQMVKDGVYEKFKRFFKEMSGKSWLESREDFYYEEDSIVKSLSETTKMSEKSARNWYNKCEENYSLSIDKFTSRVKEYIKSKGKNHHVIFMVDEMGQYIGDNTKLMLNLQTLVEDLGTKCGGKCWVVVTSQEGLDEFTKVKGNDFSKIQGRFNIRLSLSSANVDEVIKKRILRKKNTAESYLRLLYEQKESIIKNLLTFTSDTAEMKIYRNEKEFAEVYPFIPYQFNLIQSVFNGVREHGASGKSLSRGERSLLGAYQQVAVDYMEEDTRMLVPFSSFYKTIEIFLDSSIRSVVIYAEKNEKLDAFDVKVLKLLFLLKYVKEIKANIENISTLLVNRIDADKLHIKKDVQISLKKLMRQTLIQKNGEEYVFLTNDEQDVNREINNMPVDIGKVTHKISEIIFDDIYNGAKFSYSRRYQFTFNKIVDDRTIGSQINEIGVRVITPSFELSRDSSEAELKLLSVREGNVILDISQDYSYLDEIENMLKIDEYLRIKSGIKSSAAVEDIKVKKSRERGERAKRAKFLIEGSMEKAPIYINGSLVDINEKNPIDRMNSGLRILVNSKYNKLNYVEKFTNSVKELYDIVDKKFNQMEIADTNPNKLAVDEIQNHIQISSSRNLQVTVKTVLAKFSNPPYGWKGLDIAAVIIELFKKQCIKVILNGEVISPNDREIVHYVTKREYVERTILKIRERVSQKYVDTVRDLSRDMFNFLSLPSDEDGIMDIFKGECKNELSKINEMLVKFSSRTRYPGEEVLQLGKRLFQKIMEITDTVEFFKRIYDLEENFLDYEDDVDDIKAFFYKKENGVIDFSSTGEQKIIFDRAVEKLKNYDVNKEYIIDDDMNVIMKKIREILKMKRPYSRIHELPVLIEKYNDKVVVLLEEKSIPIKEFIEKCRDQVFDVLKTCSFKSIFEDKVRGEFEDLYNRVESADNFAVIASMSDLAEKVKLKWVKIIVEEKVQKMQRNNDRGPEIVVKIKTLSMRELVKGQKIIKNVQDIDEVVEFLRGKLKEELKDNTIINLI
ncbi:BREX system P-loop protein BrxC [Clostridium sp. HV4-5-A1G]|uniref:BREX system P-loop protein BrxC n=1 Tax=Clostridium sp. HV4-5-A1G TaxID=2004595 RepID=UPI00123B643D|nr:BREX system P-loop protein BrxC [Clostridium sp. HV4-5-A1G]KAA8678777.1 BREX system P-loop protein BrxC [Clostridium sp. HV4-5-A1G]